MISRTIEIDMDYGKDFNVIYDIPSWCGVYIYTTELGNQYVGFSIDINRRIYEHIFDYIYI